MGHALVLWATRAHKTPSGGTGDIVEEAIQTRLTGEVVILLPTRWVTLPEDDVDHAERVGPASCRKGVATRHGGRRKKTHTST